MALNADDPNQLDPTNPWLTGDATNAATDPSAQMQATTNPWMPTQPSAPVQLPTTPAPKSTGGPVASAPYTQDLGQTATPGAGTAQAGAASPYPPGAGPWIPPTDGPPQSSTIDYSSLMSAVSYATTPQGKAVAQDALARALQGDLEGDGHTVKWQGDTLMIDGRPYEVVGTSFSPGTAPPGGMPLASAGPGAPASSTTVPNGDYQTWFQNLISSMGNPASSYDLIAQLQPQLEAAGIKVNYNLEGQPSKLILPNGHYISVVDANGAWRWQDQGTPADNAGGGGASTSAMQFSPSALASGDLSSLPDWLKNPTADPDLTALAGQIPDYATIYQQLAGTNPEEQATSDLVTNILQHPESLSDTDVARLKAQNAEQAAAASQSQDEELQHFGASAGLDTSPWLAAQRGANAWNRRTATISSNAQVDTAAAQTRQADRLAAANLGQGFAQYQTTKSQQAINLAVESVGAKGNLEQAAKQLGLSKNQLLVSYIGQNLNYDINLDALNEKSTEFIQTLAQRISEMKQNDDQFQANFGLALKQFQENKDQNAWLRAQQTFTPTAAATGS